MEKDFDKTDSLIESLLEKGTPKIKRQVNYKMNLAAKIYAGMKAKGWNKIQFAKQICRKPSIITRWLSGTHNFETDTLFEIQNLLDIELLNLDKESNEMPMKKSFTLKGKSTNFLPPVDEYGGKVAKHWGTKEILNQD